MYRSPHQPPRYQGSKSRSKVSQARAKNPRPEVRVLPDVGVNLFCGHSALLSEWQKAAPGTAGGRIFLLCGRGQLLTMSLWPHLGQVISILPFPAGTRQMVLQFLQVK